MKMARKKTRPSAEGGVPRDLPPAKYVPYHDDPPCRTRLDACGDCPVCGFHPDMQSLCLVLHCPRCDVPLEEGVCPACWKWYEPPR